MQTRDPAARMRARRVACGIATLVGVAVTGCGNVVVTPGASSPSPGATVPSAPPPARQAPPERWTLRPTPHLFSQHPPLPGQRTFHVEECHAVLVAVDVGMVSFAVPSEASFVGFGDRRTLAAGAGMRVAGPGAFTLSAVERASGTLTDEVVTTCDREHAPPSMTVTAVIAPTRDLPQRPRD